MALFRKKTPSISLIAAFVGGGVATLAAVGYGIYRLVDKQTKADVETETTDFSDPYIPSPPRRGSRKAVHATV